MTLNELRQCSCKQLGEMAKRQQIAGWHAMRKDELVEALHRDNRNQQRRAARRSAAADANGRNKGGGAPKRGLRKNGQAASKTRPSPSLRNGKGGSHNGEGTGPRTKLPLWLATAEAAPEEQPTGLFAAACDPRWIHVSWCLTRRMVDRALASLGLQKHTAVPVIRVFDATPNDQSNGGAALVKEVEIGEDVENWYVQVADPSRTYKIHIGLRSAEGRFATIARSRGVQLPRTEHGGTMPARHANGNGHSSGKSNHHPSHVATHIPSVVGLNGKKNGTERDFQFEIDAELIVHGNTHPDAELTLFGEPVPLREDGTFSLRVRVPEGRQVIPAQAVTPNRSERRTIVLSLERNTKELEPQSMEDTAI